MSEVALKSQFKVTSLTLVRDQLTAARLWCGGATCWWTEGAQQIFAGAFHGGVPLLPLLTMLFLLGLPSARDTPSPIDPESIQVPLSYEPDPADLALSSVPGQEMFDPRKRKFSAEELKPQPMIKKARKVFIPEDMKVRRRPAPGAV